MDRRNFVRGSAALAGGLMLGGSAFGVQPPTDAPNIILLVADDLGWKDIGCYGNSDIKMPNIDELARQGVRFTEAFVAAPTCSASRSSIITGQSSHSVGVLGLTHRHRQYQMSPRIPTLARTLKNSGYRTAIAGKWDVAFFKPVSNYGYQVRLSIQYVNSSRPARKFITANKERPFYLELDFFQTHRSARGKFKIDPAFPVDPDSISVPEYWQLPNWPEIRQDVAGYYSQAAGMDKIIGEVLDHLESLNITRRTLVLFVSDNGPPYPGCKMTCYDRGIGTPLIMSWPEGLPAGETRDALVSTIDIMPTCLEAVGVGIPKAVQGLSLLNTARGKNPDVHDTVFAEVTYHIDYLPTRAARTKKWKYIENLSPEPSGLDQNEKFEWAQKIAKLPGQRCCAPRPATELYDLEKDPHEKFNLVDSSAHAQVRADMKKRLDKWRRDTHDPLLK